MEAEFGIGAKRVLSGGRGGRPDFDRVVRFRLETGVGFGSGSKTALISFIFIIISVIIIVYGGVVMGYR